MHCLLAKLRTRLFVLFVVRPSKSNLVTWFLIDACCTGVPIFNIKSAQETRILVCKLFHWVWDAWNTRLYILDHLGLAHVWHGYVVVSTVFASVSIVSIIVSLSIAPVQPRPRPWVPKQLPYLWCWLYCWYCGYCCCCLYG